MSDAKEDSGNESLSLYKKIPDDDGEVPPRLSKIKIVVLNLSWLGICLILMAITVIVMPAQVQSMVGVDAKGRWLGGILAGGAVLMVITGPLVGEASDRITSRFGRRRPVMLATLVIIWIGLAGMALSAPQVVFQHLLNVGEPASENKYCDANVSLEEHRCRPYNTPAMLTSGLNFTQQTPATPAGNHTGVEENKNRLGVFVFSYLILITSHCALTVVYQALIADVSHPDQRGITSGVMAAMMVMGHISGTGVGYFFMRLGVLTTYSIVAAVAGVCVITTMIFATETPSKGSPKPWDCRNCVFLYWETFKDHDFRWVFFTRLLIQQGIATATNFLEYWLADMTYLPNCWSPTRGVAVLFIPMLLSASISSIIGGIVSDRIGKRKPIIFIASMLMCAAAVTIAILRGRYAFYGGLAASFVYGVAYGKYLSVDFALVMDVLKEDTRKGIDIAVWHQSLVLPHVLATPIGGALLDGFEQVNCRIGLGYIILFLVTGLYFFLGGILIFKIKGVE